jgi:hypothetical protein
MDRVCLMLPEVPFHLPGIHLETKRMKAYLFILGAISLLCSCQSSNKLRTVHFNSDAGKSLLNAKLKIPAWASIKKIKADAESGKENQYLYPDSSVFYITNKQGTPNYSLIRSQENAYSKQFMSDSLSLTGIDEKGNYWREIKYLNLFYGYKNVPLNKKQLFDEALRTLKIE